MGEGLEPIPGDTFAVRAEMKALGAVWDPSRRAWCIAAEKMPLARAIVENQALAPPPVAAAGADLDALADPFEEMGEGPRLVALTDQGGDTYAARDALRAVGARWDRESRAWVIREERAAYARAIVASVGGRPVPATSPERSGTEDPPRSNWEAPTREEAGSPPVNVTPVAGTAASRAPATRLPAAPPVPGRSDPRTDPVPRATTATSQAAHPMAERIKLGGLWLNRTKDGREYLSGRLSPTVKILIFQNDFKTNENQPSHVMYLAPVETEETQQRKPPPDSFFSSGVRTGGGAGTGPTSDEGFDTGDYDDAFSAPEEDAPAALPPSSRPAPASATRPQAGAPPQRVPPAGGASRPPASRQPVPEATTRRTNPAAPARRPEPVADDSEDPFSE